MPDSNEDKVKDQCTALDCRKPDVEFGLCGEHLRHKKRQARKLKCLLSNRVYAMLILSEPKFVKFGITRRIEHRRANLQTSSPHEIKILGSFFGTFRDEQAIHDSLKEYHVRGEWFRYEGKAKDIADGFASGDWDAVKQCFCTRAAPDPLSFEEKLAAIVAS